MFIDGDYEIHKYIIGCVTSIRIIHRPTKLYVEGAYEHLRYSEFKAQAKLRKDLDEKVKQWQLKL